MSASAPPVLRPASALAAAPAALFLAALLAVQSVSALELPEVFSDHLVLQRGKRVAIWGRALPDEKVTVALAGRETRAQAAPDGRWIAWFDPLEANAVGADLVVSGSSGERLVLRDVLVGEVWLAGGQSNMQASFYNLQHDNSPEESPLPEPCTFPGVRFFTVPTRVSPEPINRALTWKISSPETVLHFSAVAFYFARDLHRRLGVPVGIVTCAWGGTYAETWMPPAILLDDPFLAPILERQAAASGHWADADAYEQAEKDYQADYATWQRALNAWKKKVPGAVRPGPQPSPPIGWRYQRRPCGLYESMLTPLMPYGIAGFIFYQGEANASDNRGWQYRHLFPKLVARWREDFRQGELPFLYVQLPPLRTKENWVDLRDSQLAALRKIPRAGMAVIADDASNRLHAPDKRAPGERLARWARVLAYGETGLMPGGPLYRSARRDGAGLVIEFDHADAGLRLREAGAKDVPIFQICGEDRVFHPAQAEIVDGDKLRLSAETVPAPLAARYAWSNGFNACLFGADDLPASPFRTDDFPLESQDKR